MKRYAVGLGAALMLVLAVAPAAEAGCFKGAVVGAVAGHYAHHHAVLGAIAGCAIGHHLAVKARQEQAAKAQQTQAQAQPVHH